MPDLLLYGPPMELNGGSTPEGEQPEQQRLGLLLCRIAQQDAAALARFYDLTIARVYTLAHKITRETQGAQDVVVEVYFQLWRQSAKYDTARGPVLAWLLTICRSRALDYLRRRDSAELHPAPEQLRPDLYRDDDSPLDLLLALERDSEVRIALSGLNDNEQRLVSLAFFQGLSHQEIAARTGTPLGSVKTTLRRVVQILRERLESAVSVPPEGLSTQTVGEIPPPRIS